MAGEAAGAASGGASAGAAGSSGAGAAVGAATSGAGGAGEGAAAPQAGAAQSGAGATAAGTSDWTTGLNDEFKGYAKNKGWKDVPQVLDSYRNMEKLLGAPQDQIIRMPKADDPAAWDSVYTRLGKPASPDGYKLETPKETGDPAFTKWAQEQFHKAGLTVDQGKALAKEWNDQRAAVVKANQESYTAKATADVALLKKEWGAAYEKELGVAKRAYREFGVSDELVGGMEKAIGTAETMKFFQKIGSKLGDPAFHSGSPSNEGGPMTPEQAKDQIKALMADADWSKKYMGGDAKARAQFEILHKYANPET